MTAVTCRETRESQSTSAPNVLRQTCCPTRGQTCTGLELNLACCSCGVCATDIAFCQRPFDRIDRSGHWNLHRNPVAYGGRELGRDISWAENSDVDVVWCLHCDHKHHAESRHCAPPHVGTQCKAQNARDTSLDPPHSCASLPSMPYNAPTYRLLLADMTRWTP